MRRLPLLFLLLAAAAGARASANLAIYQASGLAQGTSTLYFINYSMAGTGSENYVQDSLLSCAYVVGASSNPFDNSAATVSGNTVVTWRLPNAPAGVTVTGVLWVEVNDLCGGSSVCNSASYSTVSSTGPWNSTASSETCTSAGGSELSLVKQQYNQSYAAIPNGMAEPAGTVVHYVLTYTLSGEQLDCFDSFDSYAAGAYAVGVSANQSPSPSEGFGGTWIAQSQSSAYTADWSVVDDGNAESENYLYYGSTSQAACLLNTCPSMGSSFCGGMVTADVDLLENNGTMEAGLVVRSDSNAGDPNYGAQYTAVLSMNAYAAASAGAPYNAPAQGLGHLFIEKTAGVGGWSATSWSGGATYSIALDSDTATYGATLPADTWYTLEVEEVPQGSTTTSGAITDTLYAKFWPQGAAEPAGWMVQVTDPDAFGCAGTWYPGVEGLSANAGFDNFQVYGAAGMQGADLWDTVPTGIAFTGANPQAQIVPAAGSSGQIVQWNFSGGLNGASGSLLEAGTGSFTWSGTTTCISGTITNYGYMGDAVFDLVSNSVTLSLACSTPTDTPSPTSTPSFTASPVVSPTISPTATPSFTASPVVSPTISPTATPSFTASPVVSPTISSTATPSITPSPSSTPSFTASPLVSATLTPTATPATSTITPSPSFTPSFTASPLVSGTLTPTATATATPTPTLTPSPSATTSAWSTATPYLSPTPTATSTPTPSPTASPTAEESPEGSPTDTPSITPSSTTPTSVSGTASPTASLPGGGLGVWPNLLHLPGESARVIFVSNSGGHGRVKILRDNGHHFRALWEGELQAQESHTEIWDGKDDAGEDAASGVYYVVFMDGDGSRHVQKALVIR